MITGKLRSQVDKLWEEFWTGGITNPLTVIEQITFLMFARMLDLREQKLERINMRTGKAQDFLFADDQQHLRWSKFKDLRSTQMLPLIRDEVFPHFRNVAIDGAVYAEYMKDAQLLIQKESLLVSAVGMVDALPLEDDDSKGDLYEYLLSKLTTAGINGQFRTPRHIIRFMVDMLEPKPTETVGDPACGTGGFLVGVAQYLWETYTSPDQVHVDPATGAKSYSGDLLEPHMDHVRRHMFHGFDFDSTMLRIAAMNMLLHGIDAPDIHYQDTLATGFTERFPKRARDAFDIILANPPFKGSLDEEDVHRSLTATVKTKKTELLFITLILRMLKLGGRSATVVPDGVLFGSSKAHQGLRQKLVDENQLEGVISLPSGVFRPYAGVSTAILVFTKGGRTEQGLVLRGRSRRTVPRRPAQPRRRQRPARCARPLAEAERSERRSCGPDQEGLLGSGRGNSREQVRPLRQPLQESGLRGGGVRPADADTRRDEGAGSRDRGGHRRARGHAQGRRVRPDRADSADRGGGMIAVSETRELVGREWPRIPLGDIVRVVGGGTPDRKTDRFWGGPIPWATVKDFDTIRLRNTQESITQQGVEASATNVIPAGNVIVPTRMAVGKAAINEVTLAINQDLKALFPSANLDSGFLLHVLLSRAPILLSAAKGATVKGITLDVLRELEIPLPPLEEQRRIAAILDKADAIRRKRAQALAHADTFLRSVFLEMFGDPIANPKRMRTIALEDAVDPSRQITYGIVQAGPHVEGGVPYVKSGDIKEWSIAAQNLARTSPEIAASYRRSAIRSGDIVFSIRASVGAAAIAGPELDGANLTQGTARIACNADVVGTLFMFEQIRTAGFQARVDAKLKGATFREITLGALRSVEVIVPPIDLQLAFEELCRKVNRERELAKTALSCAAELTSALPQELLQ
ncbi:MAG: N-6 DNA methylase [Thalassobaculum sp.]